MENQKFSLPPGPVVSFWEVVREKALVMLGLAVLGLGSLYALEYFRPGQENTTMSGVILAVFAAVLAYLKSEQSHLIMNNRMTEWLQNADKVAESRGYAQAVSDLELKELRHTELAILRERKLVEDRARDAAEVLRVAQETALAMSIASAAPAGHTPPDVADPTEDNSKEGGA
jgi:hypothetical protein